MSIVLSIRAIARCSGKLIGVVAKRVVVFTFNDLLDLPFIVIDWLWVFFRSIIMNLCIPFNALFMCSFHRNQIKYIDVKCNLFEFELLKLFQSLSQLKLHFSIAPIDDIWLNSCGSQTLSIASRIYEELLLCTYPQYFKFRMDKTVCKFKIRIAYTHIYSFTFSLRR